MKPTHSTRRKFIERGTATLGVMGLTGCMASDHRGSHLHSKTSQSGPAGYWPLESDCRDHSGHTHHGVNHGAPIKDGTFNGTDSFVEILAHPDLSLQTGDFSISAWVHTARDLNDVLGDIVCQFDSAARRGFSLALKSSSGGYSSHGDDRQVHFGIDNGVTGEWQDCGRPSPTSNYVSNSLTVYDGALYAAITDAAKFEDWCHVFRYAGEKNWEDCGRVGDRRTHGVGPMIVHQGHLYAATWTYDWNRVGRSKPLDDFCSVYRYEGARKWADCGQPGSCRRLFGLGSYRGHLYVTAEDGKCYVWDGERRWTACGRFPNYAHPVGIHDRRLYVGVLNPAGVWAYDGNDWKALGNPQGSEERCNQIHALEVYRGQLYATTWPEGRVCLLEADGRWTECGRLGESLEINALTVYNGKLYGGTIPYAEVFRYEGEQSWTKLKRFFEPQGGIFQSPNEWTRVTSLTVFDGRLFASIGSCTSSILDAPCDVRGTVWSMEAGKSVTYGKDPGPGWKHIVAVRSGNHLEIHINGRREVISSPFNSAAFDLSTSAPLRIGCGETNYFNGRIRELRLYRRNLSASEIDELYADGRRLGFLSSG